MDNNKTSINLIRQRASKKVDKFFTEEFGIDINTEAEYKNFRKTEEMRALASVEVVKPKFPIILFSIALVLDLVDVAQLTGIGWFIMVIVNAIFFVILLIWIRKRLSIMFRAGSKRLYKGPMKKILIRNLNRMTKKIIGRYVSRRLAAILIVNFIPFIGILSSWAFFVVLAHNKQKKIARGYMFMVEKIESATRTLNRERLKIQKRKAA